MYVAGYTDTGVTVAKYPRVSAGIAVVAVVTFDPIPGYSAPIDLASVGWDSRISTFSSCSTGASFDPVSEYHSPGAFAPVVERPWIPTGAPIPAVIAIAQVSPGLIGDRVSR